MKKAEIFELIYKDTKTAIEIYGKAKKKIQTIVEDLNEEIEDGEDSPETHNQLQRWKNKLKETDQKVVQLISEKKADPNAGMKRIV